MCHIDMGYHHHRGNRNRLLRLKSITLHLSLSATSTTFSFLPETLTFVFPPRISGGHLQINDSYFLMDSPAFLSLHRRTHSGSGGGGGGAAAVFTSDDRVLVSNGAVFEVHVGGNRLIRGVFRLGDGGGMRMECKCVAASELGVEEAVVVTVAEGGAVMREKVNVKVTAAKRRRFCRKYEVALEEIPEERECDVAEEDDDVERHGLVCSCSCDDHDEWKIESEGGYDFDHMMEMEMEGVRWAVDMGIWAVCIGLGFLASKASVRSLRRSKKIVNCMR